MIKDFGTVIDESFRDFKKHRGLFLEIGLVLYLLPYFLFMFLYLLGIIRTASKFGFIFLNILYVVTIIRIQLHRKTKMEISLLRAIKEGMHFMLKGISLIIILVAIFSVTYSINYFLGFLFSIFFIFSFYIYITEGISIFDSIEKSFIIVKKNFLIVFMNVIFFTLILYSVKFITYGLILFFNIVGLFIAGFVYMLMLLFTVLFFERFYLDLKN